METEARDLEPFLFEPRGTLYSYSTIHVSATRPTRYTLGYVDFPDGMLVLAHVELRDGGEPLSCDQVVELRAQGDEWFVASVTGSVKNMK